MTSQCGPRRPNPNETKMRRRYNVACRVGLQLEEQKKFSLKTQCLSCQTFNSRSSNRNCSAKKLLIKISQISQESTCPRVSFLIKLQRPATLLKNRSWHRCFLVKFVKFLRTEHLFYRAPLDDCFHQSLFQTSFCYFYIFEALPFSY